MGQGLVICPGWFPVHLIPSPQERFQVKNPPAAYIQKLKSYLETGGVSRKVAADWMSNLGVHASPFFSVSFTLYLLSSGHLDNCMCKLSCGLVRCTYEFVPRAGISSRFLCISCMLLHRHLCALVQVCAPCVSVHRCPRMDVWVPLSPRTGRVRVYPMCASCGCACVYVCLECSCLNVHAPRVPRYGFVCVRVLYVFVWRYVCAPFMSVPERIRLT